MPHARWMNPQSILALQLQILHFWLGVKHQFTYLLHFWTNGALYCKTLTSVFGDTPAPTTETE